MRDTQPSIAALPDPDDAVVRTCLVYARTMVDFAPLLWALFSCPILSPFALI